MSDEIGDLIHKHIAEVMKPEAAMVETACEKALVSGTDGVLVVRDPDGRVIAAESTNTVPYGYIREISLGHAPDVEPS